MNLERLYPLEEFLKETEEMSVALVGCMIGISWRDLWEIYPYQVGITRAQYSFPASYVSYPS